MGNGTFNQSHLKANLQMGISRLTIMKNKRINQISVSKDEIANLLRSGKEEMAMIKVESIINHENFITAIEVLVMFCAQLNERVFQIASAQKCPPDLNIAIETVIWASTKIDCKELIEARTILGAKFGYDFCRNAAENRDGQVNSIVRDKLVTAVPDEESKVIKIQEIASEKRIDFVFKHHIRQEIMNSHMPSVGFGQGNNVPPSNQGNFPPPNQGNFIPPPSGNYPPPPGNYPPPSGNYPPPPGNYPPPPGNYPPPPGNYPPSSGNYPPPSGNYPQTSGNYPPPPANYSPPPSENCIPPSAPGNFSQPSGFSPAEPFNPEPPAILLEPKHQEFDIDSLEERFKRLK
ncbi:hypothetical protein SteCoe_24978 [Stentor coeruleus]|uniref:IST1 homolog n=1 Tax=Stentor coeruleus TaxID=5963 RepID=A0A1R2BGD5_9CILI|nr:hypothetical protein SteCoe_24978 [Stentor coeruleus]